MRVHADSMVLQFPLKLPKKQIISWKILTSRIIWLQIMVYHKLCSIYDINKRWYMIYTWYKSVEHIYCLKQYKLFNEQSSFENPLDVITSYYE